MVVLTYREKERKEWDGEGKELDFLEYTYFSGTTIKDTWTKSRGSVQVGEGGGFGWGRVEGWGEKAYNYN